MSSWFEGLLEGLLRVGFNGWSAVRVKGMYGLQAPLAATGKSLRIEFNYDKQPVPELLAERSLHADHVTVWRWVQRYASTPSPGSQHPAQSPLRQPIATTRNIQAAAASPPNH
jgi:hypothetical protein